MASAPPPGIDLNDDISQTVIRPVVALLVLSITAVSLRITSRVISGQPLKWDDFFAVLAAVFACGTGALSIVSCHYGLGKHIWAPSVNLKAVVQILWAYEFFYGAVIPTVKMSLIMFYHRLFPVRKVTLALRFCAFLVLGWYVSVQIVVIAQCKPYNYFWEQYINPEFKGSCVNFYAFFVSNASLSVLTDFMVLLIPIPMVLNLQMPLTQRLIVCGIFMLGGFVCIAGIVRIHFLTLMFKSPDLTWNMAQSFVWSCVEPCIGIVCGCLPTLRPVISRCFPRFLHSQRSTSQTPNNYISNSSSGAGATFKAQNRDFLRLQESKRKKKMNPLMTTDTVADDDEVGLTNAVENGHRQGVKYDDSKIPMNSIVVQRDIEWSESSTNL
ncbi:hypothetical protein VTN77DRAFT_3456 [Rasamsonia byssochlamydoides]|uniref:uncharacterized protein n=1 Tax=Rasamsonia byssochlamydoides TaxID=89139 RepID=UPI003742B39F